MDHKCIIEDCARLVYRQLGRHLSECAYQKAFQHELSCHFKSVQIEHRVNQYYVTSKGSKVQISTLRVDILVDEKIVIELKALPSSLNSKAYSQCRRYLDILGFEEGFLINFGYDGLEIELIQCSKKNTAA